MQGTYNISVRQVGDDFVATGCINMGNDYSLKAVARVSAKAIEGLLRRAATGWSGSIQGGPQVLGFGFIKKLWRGAKKIAKKVATSKVLRKVANTVRNPAFMAALSVVPGIGPVAAGGLAAAGTAYMGLRSAVASKQGKRRTVAAAKQMGRAMAKKYGISPARANAAWKFGRQLAVDPRMMQFMYQGPQRSPQMPSPLSRLVPQVAPQFMQAFGGGGYGAPPFRGFGF